VVIPTFFVTGDDDEIVPYKQTIKLHDLATSTRFKELYVVKGGDHNGSFLKEPKVYLSKMEAFIRKCILEFEPMGQDDWSKGATGEHIEETEELLEMQQEHQDSKVKISKVDLPAGTIAKMKESAIK